MTQCGRGERETAGTDRSPREERTEPRSTGAQRNKTLEE